MKKYFLLISLFFLVDTTTSGQLSKREINRAMKSDDTSSVSALISKTPDINKLFFGKTLLHWAVFYNRLAAVKLIVNKGADINSLDDFGDTPLSSSTLYLWPGDSITEFLILNGANPNIAPVKGIPPIMMIIQSGQWDPPNEYLFKLLLDHGADITLTGCTSITAFLRCCAWGTPQMLQYLLARKIDINQYDYSNGMNGLMFAIARQPRSWLFKVRDEARSPNIDVIKFLLRNGIDVNHRDNIGKTALDYADWFGDEEVARLIIEAPAYGSQQFYFPFELFPKVDFANEYEDSSTIWISTSYEKAGNKIDSVKTYAKFVPNQFDTFRVKWYSEDLYALHEPILFNNESGKEIFRFTWLRTSHNPIAIRIEKNGSDYRIIWKVCNGTKGYSPGVLITDKEKAITKEQWDKFQSLLANADYWNLKNDYDFLGAGVSRWILEGKTSIKYHFVDWWTPSEKSKYYQCCDYLIGLTDLEIKSRDKY